MLLAEVVSRFGTGLETFIGWLRFLGFTVETKVGSWFPRVCVSHPLVVSVCGNAVTIESASHTLIALLSPQDTSNKMFVTVTLKKARESAPSVQDARKRAPKLKPCEYKRR